MGKVQIYEGHLPEAVSRDFIFDRSLNAKGEAGKSDTYLRYKHAGEIKKNDYSQRLINVALDNARKNLETLLAGMGPSDLEIVADFHVIRENRTSDFEAFVSNEGHYPKIELVVEAIGYKRRTSS